MCKQIVPDHTAPWSSLIRNYVFASLGKSSFGKSLIDNLDELVQIVNCQEKAEQISFLNDTS